VLNAKSGEVLWKFQTGFAADAPPSVYEVDGQEYIVIVTGGNSIQGSATGDGLWVFGMNGNMAPQPPSRAAGPLGPIADGTKAIKIGDNNVEYAYWPARTPVKAGTTVTFTNVGDIVHTATSTTATGSASGKWDTGALAKGDSKSITLSELGTYYYICTPHPWMYGQVIVEPP
jgi:plastocyanin